MPSLSWLGRLNLDVKNPQCQLRMREIYVFTGEMTKKTDRQDVRTLFFLVISPVQVVISHIGS